MPHPDALLPTVQQVTAVPPPPPPRRNTGALVAITAVAAALVGVIVGVAIGRSSPSPTPQAAPVVASTGGHVGVSSKPVDGNVTVDGRFVGVTPVERIDLDAGKHSVVIDAFGYQPYAGTLEVLPKSQINLRVLLAPMGGSGSTSGDVTGGKAITVVVPPTALLPPVRPEEPKTSSAKPATRAAPSPTYEPPPRPRRDCDGDRSRCTQGCSHAHTDCDFSCQSCYSCLSSQTSDQCRQLCDSCRSGCSQNSKFCESSCDTQHNNCESSQ